MKAPTIYEALATKLGREPTNAELKADWNRILDESLADRSPQGKIILNQISTTEEKL